MFERLGRVLDQIHPVELPKGVIAGPTRRITEEREAGQRPVDRRRCQGAGEQGIAVGFCIAEGEVADRDHLVLIAQSGGEAPDILKIVGDGAG